MDFATIVFAILVAIFAWRGYQKGFIGSITRILSWLIAYPAAIFFTKPLAKLLILYTALDGLIVFFIAGSGIFLGVGLLVTLVLNGLAKLVPENPLTSNGSKYGGLAVGILFGSVIGLIAAYAISLIPKNSVIAAQSSQPSMTENLATETENGVSITQKSGRKLTPVPNINQLNKAKDSFIETQAKKLMGTAAATAVDIALNDETATQMTRSFVEDPQSTLTHVQAMANNGQMKALLSDEKIQTLLTTGDVYALERNKDFQALMHNEDMQALLAQSDVSSEKGARAAAEKMVAAWTRVNLIKHDPRVIAIINDPEFQAQLNSQNKLPLMMNPKLKQLTEIIFNAEPIAANGMGAYEVKNLSDQDANNPDDSSSENSDKPKTTIYRWTDENGQVHYSDKPVNN